MKNNYKITLFSLLISLAFLILLGAISGTLFLNPFDGSARTELIIWQIRMPRIILAGLAGALLSVSGTILQSILKNPLSDPYILGISSGGGLGAVIALSFSLPIYYVSAAAFLGSAITILAVYQLARISGKVNPLSLILAGVAFSSLLGALLTFIVILGNRLQSVYYWMLGSFSNASWEYVGIASICAAIGIPSAFLMSKKLNILSLGEDEALSLGIDVSKDRFIALMLCSFMTGVSVSFCGIIGFVGLIVPHIMRRIVGGNNTYLIPTSAILGACLLIASDILSRSAFAPNEIPIGILTAMLGAPFFLFLLRQKGTS